MQLHPQKTRIVHVRQGFEFLGYKIKRGQGSFGCRRARSAVVPNRGRCMRIPARNRSAVSWIRCARLPGDACRCKTKELIEELNPVLRGWGHYYKRAHVRKLFHQLDGWIVRRIRSHRFKRWRNGGWKQLPEAKLYGEYGLVNLVRLIPSLAISEA